MRSAQYLPSALSKVAILFWCYERIVVCSSRTLPRISNDVRVSLERAPVGGRLLPLSVAVVSGCRFRPDFGRKEFGNFYFCSFFFLKKFMLLSSAFTFGDSCTSSDTTCPVPLWVSLMVALSGSLDTTFNLIACCAPFRTFTFLCHPSLFMAQGGNMFTCALSFV